MSPSTPRDGAPANPRTSSDSDSFSSGRHSSSHEYDSSSALIIVSDEHGEIDHDPESFEFSSDDDDRETDEQFDHARTSSVPPLSSPAVFLYLLSPLVKLGALLSVEQSAQLPLKVALPGLFFFACLCAFTRQVWYMLARYVRRVDMEEVLLETFARGRGKEQKRHLIRMLVRSGTAALRLLLVSVYLRASADAIIPFLPESLAFLPTRIVVTVVLALCVSPLCFASSLGSSVVLYSTWLSVTTYVAWVACTAYTHAQGMFAVSPTDESLGVLWQGLSIVAFTFTTHSTLPLYGALKGTYQPGMPKAKRSRSFKILSLLSIVIATLLVLPPTIFRSNASPLVSQHVRTPSLGFRSFVAFLCSVTLLLGIPSVLITTSALPVPLAIRRNTNLPVSRLAYFLFAFALALLPRAAARVLSDVLLAMLFLSTFTVPALVHIVIHNFRRPLAIVMPPGTPATPSHPSLQHSDSYNDELLQRKERTLQRRRFARRVFWDVGVWVLLLPVSGGGLFWAVGRVAQRW